MVKLMLERNQRLAIALSELEVAVFQCLVCYWIDQGTPRGCAELAARKVVDLLRRDKDDKTWCISSCANMQPLV